MKSLQLLPALLFLTIISLAQQPTITWGEEFKMRRGSTDLEVVYADNSGVYLEEGHLALKGYFVIAATSRSSASLIKLDNDLKEVYRNDFNKELKGKEFEQIYMLQDKMLLIATDFNKDDQALELYAEEIDKSSGALLGDWKLLTSFQKEQKKDAINFKIIPSQDSSKMVIVGSVEGKESNNYKIQEFDKNLAATKKAVNISNEFDPKTFQLEDVIYTLNKKIFLVGREYEYQEGKRKKDKFLDFVNYNIRLYNENGKQEKEINTTINGKWLVSSKLIQKGDKDLVLAAFFSKTKKGKTIDGLLIQRINSVTGEVVGTSEKEMNNSMLSNDNDVNADDASDDTETKDERKERERLEKLKEDAEGFSRFMQFRNIYYTADNGIIFLAEKYHHYVYANTTYNPSSAFYDYSTSTISAYDCDDIMMCKVDAAGNVSWLKVLPKKQQELIYEGFTHTMFAVSFFDPANRPFYASFGAMQNGGTIHLLFNDNPKNAAVLSPGQKVKSTTRFFKTDCFIVSLNEQTGKYTRNKFFSNGDVPTAMPRLGAIIGKNMYMVGKTDRGLAKAKIAVAKIKLD